MASPPPGMVLVFALVLVALVLFVTERLPNDTTALAVLVSLVVFEPWTGVTAAEAISGFASPATLTIVAMYMLSEGIQRTGLVERLGTMLGEATGGNERKLLGATVGTTGLAASVVNNTPIVAVFIPMITDLAGRYGLSPSKLLLPLSYAAMLGGTLTLVGTATNILASDLSSQLLGHQLSMFEFTKLGVVIFLVGAAYLLTVGRWLTPARIDPAADLTETFDLGNHLVRLVVRESSPLIGYRVDEAGEELAAAGYDLDILQIERDGEAFLASATDRRFEDGDLLTVRTSLQTANRVAGEYGLRHRHRDEVTEDDLSETPHRGTLVEVVIPGESRFVGKRIGDSALDERFDTTVLAVRRGDEVTKRDLDAVELRAGDTLLLQTTAGAIAYLADRDEVFVTHEAEDPGDLDEAVQAETNAEPLDAHTPVAVAILLGVIAIAALGLLPIVIAALGGVVAMVATGCLRPSEAYEAVSWNVVFLLAGVIPLGLAMQNTGGDALLASLLVASTAVLPLIGVLALVYLVTSLLANVITPVATVVLMIPVAVDTAARIGATRLTFLLAVMFAASTAFMTPIGYQTNLMVYGPGGYRFTDYVRVGAPLQALMAVVTTVGLVVFWGLR
ncbi:SLC13 family permease [Haloplanus aerogenes]|uniref:SLC13 family permease n=1 Tax=Haloplanus aerogenes TaxID=660522 RepID=A0A3M0D0L7_9EURY|nr:SLC13 family permease [Haloplanus aerogenes]AZH24067.1 SLC13 family permease [Haloplanus aerogenes]RMB13156.1 TrkA family protein [Haloplanus aerogenes]